MTEKEFEDLSNREVDLLIYKEVVGRTPVTEHCYPHYCALLDSDKTFYQKLSQKGEGIVLKYIDILRIDKEVDILSSTGREKCKAALMAIGFIK